MTATNETPDRRRYGVIEVEFLHLGDTAAYNLNLGGQTWACVEWSASRRAWCVQDAGGECLAHCDAIHGEHIDAATAVQLAKAMIRDGRMPTPEDAAQRLQERLKRDHLGEPWELLRADRVEAPLPNHTKKR